MTVQQGLSLVWASTGGVTDPGDVKYQTGWIAEIPTYQNFNWVLQNATKNLLSLAESGAHAWEATIAYEENARVIDGATHYYCIVANTNQQPSLDTLGNYWSLSPTYGGTPSITNSKLGLTLDYANPDTSNNLWNGNAMTMAGHKTTIGFVTTAKTWLLSNVNSEMVLVDTGAVTVPDSRNIAPGQAGVSRLFHEAHAPIQSEVDGTIPQEPQDGILYARRNDSWVEVTSTTIATAPPPPVQGAGAEWYNLDDGQLYIDIDDGNTSQWVPASPPNVIDFSGPEEAIVDADKINFEDVSDGSARKAITFDNLKRDLVDHFYPIGTVLTTSDLTNPGVKYPGTTWIPTAEGRVVIGVGTAIDDNGNPGTVLLGDTGGEFDHVLTNGEMPRHRHGIAGTTAVDRYGGGTSGYAPSDSTNILSQYQGNNEAHNNVQPFVAYHIWLRTA